MEITPAIIDHLADLSKLEFTRQEMEQLHPDLDRILAFVGKLNELDLRDIEPLVYLSDRIQALRPDESKEDISREEALRNAPQTDGTHFIVPKVIWK